MQFFFTIVCLAGEHYERGILLGLQTSCGQGLGAHADHVGRAANASVAGRLASETPQLVLECPTIVDPLSEPVCTAIAAANAASSHIRRCLCIEQPLPLALSGTQTVVSGTQIATRT
jgi:hypothetical protein